MEPLILTYHKLIAKAVLLCTMLLVASALFGQSPLRQEYFDSVRSLTIYPIQQKFPFGSELFRVHEFKDGKGVNTNDCISRSELFECWSYYVGLAQNPAAIATNKRLLPVIDPSKCTAIVTGDDNHYITQNMVYRLEATHTLPKFTKRLGDMGIYEAYYIAEIDDDSLCRQTIATNKMEACCAGEDFSCSLFGWLVLYDRAQQAAKIITINLSNGSEWRYFHIPNSSTIQLYEGWASYSDYVELKYSWRITIQKDGTIEKQQLYGAQRR